MIRQQILNAAEGWIGTPYHHQASLKGVGCDCLGLVRGIWREVFGEEPEAPPPYRPDWSVRDEGDPLRAAADRWLVPISEDALQPGHVVLFRIRPDWPARHCAIVFTPSSLLHAYWGRAVQETAFTPWWQKRVAGAYAFPGIIP